MVARNVLRKLCFDGAADRRHERETYEQAAYTDHRMPGIAEPVSPAPELKPSLPWWN